MNIETEWIKRIEILKGKRILCLVDGEHYPPVVKWTLKILEDMGGEVVSLVFLGGTEKVENAIRELKEKNSNYKIYTGQGKLTTILEVISKAIDREKPHFVVDLSDEPIIDYKDRFRIASTVLEKEVIYLGADFLFNPHTQKNILDKPSLSIIGTGKRVGKTAVSIHIARLLDKMDFDPVVVAMGRGGPSEPDYINSKELKLDPEILLKVVEKGGHAASDYWEDAMLAQVSTIGCRRCGGGMAGNPFTSNVLSGAKFTNKLTHKFVIMEGSGATLPPVKTDKTIVVSGAAQPIENITGYLGEYRIKISDMVIVTMSEEPMADMEKIKTIQKRISEIKPGIQIGLTIFRPEPLGNIKGKNVFLATTAREEIVEKLSKYIMKNYNCNITGITTNLSNRPKLREDLKKGLSSSDILLTEIKAASIDIAARNAEELGTDIVFMHNKPILTGGSIIDLDKEIISLCEKAR